MKPMFFAATLLFFFAVKLSAQVNLFVATNGSAPFHSVQAAIMSVPSGSRENPVLIHLGPGTYQELIYIQREKRYFKLIGENPANTVLSFNLYAGITNAEGKPIGTFKTPSTWIDADDFSAENITFENSAGRVGQALAIRVDGDRASFRHCRFLGNQDTILLNRGRQYFEDCYVCGTVDFIFGAATAWFEKCEIHSLSPGYLTAASTPEDVPFGYVFSHCKITGEPDSQAYLGRPWRGYASTIYLNCNMSGVVRPEGWNDWKKPEAHSTVRYAEFNSTGDGASPTNRPEWSRQLTADDARQITLEKVLGSTDGWNPTLPTLAPAIAASRYDIQYGEAGGEKLLLDAHIPPGGGTFPVLIIVHGGGWSGGDKETDIVPVFAAAITNFTWFTLNYRLAPANRWPAGYQDVETAIRWVKDHAAGYKGDPAHIALIGYSAGGHLATLAGTIADTNTRVQAVVGLAPPVNLLADARRRGLDKWSSMTNLTGSATLDEATVKLLTAMSSTTYVRPGLPPFYLIQGDADKSVYYNQTAEFQSQLKAAGISCDLLTITNGTHRIADWNKSDPGWQGKLAAWLEEKLAAR